MSTATTPPAPISPVTNPVTTTPVAVVDIGTTSVRLAIGQIEADGNVRALERLSQSVSLGKDTFTRGSIKRSTSEECVRVLSGYRRKLAEYGIEPHNVRVVATSAVREADNQLAFLDRIYSATGFQVEAIDEAEVNRVTYLGILPLLEAEPELSDGTSLIVEVGGGSTDMVLLQGSDVVYAHSFRMGALRLRETLASFNAPTDKARQIMENLINRTVEEVHAHVPSQSLPQMVTLGSDMRFAAHQLCPDWDRDKLAVIPLSDLKEFSQNVLSLSEDELVRRFPLAFAEAESMGPALMMNCQLAESFRLSKIYVSSFNLRDALLNELTLGAKWTAEFRTQIIRSTLGLAERFDVDTTHARHVAELCRQLFHATFEEHGLDDRFEVLLFVAALLHEVGLFINHRAYHKHTQYLIQNSDFFGLGKREQLLAALIARYHRRAIPKPSHDGYSTLSRDDRIAVSKMSALLRVADSLDHSRSQRVKHIRCQLEQRLFVVEVLGVDDLSLEELDLNQKGNLFEEIFGRRVVFRRVGANS